MSSNQCEVNPHVIKPKIDTEEYNTYIRQNYERGRDVSD
jgi:hypothetical protein